MKIEKYPMKMEPVYKDYLWGGDTLSRVYGKKTALRPLAESWELSCHKDGKSIIANGTYAGQALADYVRLAPRELLGGTSSDEGFPVLLKLIDAKRALSVQVHPAEAYAQSHEHDHGKTEMWVILSCEAGASLVYGVNQPLTREKFLSHIQDNTLSEVLNLVPVQPGDVIFVPPGTLHAIGAGIVIAEIQQSSNTTYRVWDYGRMGADGKPRQLHVTQACDVAILHPTPLPVFASQAETHDGWEEKLLATCAYFTTSLLTLHGAAEINVTAESYAALLCTDGSAELQDANGHAVTLIKGETVFLPAGMGACRLTGSANVICVRQGTASPAD